MPEVKKQRAKASKEGARSRKGELFLSIVVSRRAPLLIFQRGFIFREKVELVQLDMPPFSLAVGWFVDGGMVGL